MKISKIIAAAGLTVAVGAFAPSAFAQVGGAAGVPAVGGTNITGQAPSAGQPGTQAPASAAPVGSAQSDYMSSESPNAPQNSSISGPSATNKETRARWLETKVERDIVSARSNGVNVGKAAHQKWLGSVALSKGDRVDAIQHFNRAERDLRAAGFNVSNAAGSNVSRPNNLPRSNLHGNETSQELNGADMNSNRGTNAAY
jgi:hypothetical protein